ncbi:MAG TPA: S-methyl-5'-thioinosine phosphorylase [Gammaproteobacteria bacterium]|nr:S-methyl-5'-thioinosine phosphorylase [Gammaproteobacteria bacterium]
MGGEARIAILGGTGLGTLADLEEPEPLAPETPYGAPSAGLVRGWLAGRPVLFLPRHGGGHALAPHRINYRANLWALHEAGARSVIAVAAVGSIAAQPGPGGVAIPDQIIDYTWGRAHTFVEEGEVRHVDFTRPYSPALRECLLEAARSAGVAVTEGGVYGATQGPRLESAAEIARLARDGCTMVGMTGMPEAALARELELDYACCAVCVNRAAGVAPAGDIHAEIERFLEQGMQRARNIIRHAVARLGDTGDGLRS